MNLESLFKFVPAVLGCLIVIQAGLNRKIAGQWGLPSAVLLNASVLWVLAVSFYFAAFFQGNNFPSSFQVHVRGESFRAWYLLPGLFGLCLTMGGPWCISRWGATFTMVVLIAAQVTASLIWDGQVEHLTISPLRFVGVAVTLAGAVLVGLGKS